MTTGRRHRPWRAVALLACLGGWIAPAAAAPIEGSGAVLQGLDKVTARVSEIEAPLHRLVRFGTLEIIVRRCQKTPPEEPPESAAFLEIRDAKPGEAAVALFTGWMFASSPALSALEHPVYDVWVLDCLTAAEPEPEPTPDQATPSPGD